MGDRVVEVGRWDGEGADDSGVSIVRYVRGAERVGDAQVAKSNSGEMVERRRPSESGWARIWGRRVVRRRARSHVTCK